MRSPVAALHSLANRVSNSIAHVACLPLLAATGASHAHSGHGLDVPHLHLHDLVLVIGLITAIGIVTVLIGRK